MDETYSSSIYESGETVSRFVSSLSVQIRSIENVSHPPKKPYILGHMEYNLYNNTNLINQFYYMLLVLFDMFCFKLLITKIDLASTSYMRSFFLGEKKEYMSDVEAELIFIIKSLEQNTSDINLAFV